MPSPGSFFNAVTVLTRSPSSCSELRQRELQLLVRDDDLAHVTEDLGEVSVLLTRRLTLGPGPGEAVVGPATEQHDLSRTEGGVDGSTHLVVEVGEVPLVGRLDDTVE